MTERPEYPRPNAPPDEWIAWYRWKIGDMDRLLQGAYDEIGLLRRALEPKL
jgi:hypothetical protein